MKVFNKRFLYLFLTLFVTVSYLKAEVSFTASAPNAVVNGQSFQLTYVVNSTAKDLRLPDIQGFEVIAGPFSGTSTSTQIINGHVTTERSTRFTYTLLAQKEGEFTIPSATVTVGKEKYRSNALKIKVLPPDKEAEVNNSSTSSMQAITADNLFLKTIVSKTNVKEQEAIVLSYKLYYRPDVVDIQNVKLPDLKGFFVQELDLPQNQQMQFENYNGRNYHTFLLKQYLVFPQKAGNITIDAMTCDVIVRLRQQRRVRSFFDDYFDTYQDVRKSLSTNSLKIHVDALPSPKPATFNGAVGKFDMTSEINSQELNANEPLTVKLTIKGTGNIKMIKTPDLKFPADFETYEPKVTNNLKTSSAGMSGSKTIEYLAIPRHNGDFVIPSVSFSYYDIDAKAYKELSTPEFAVKVNKVSGENQGTTTVSNFTNKEQVKVLASDIRYISTEPLKLQAKETFLAGSLMFWLSYIVPALLTVLLMIFFRKQAKENADAVYMRNKKANKVVRKRLKIAEAEWKAGNKERFYDEVLKALWGYLCDKLSMPLSELNKENVAANLASHSVPLDVVDSFIELLNKCEFERYAPLTDTKSAMDLIFKESADMITTLEGCIKK